MTSPLRIRTEDLKEALGSELLGVMDRHDLAGTHAAPSQVRVWLKKLGYFQQPQAQKISVMMCKGGVGKTTTTFFLATRLASYGAKVLVVDADPQGNLTGAFAPEVRGITVDEETPVLVDVLSGAVTLSEALLQLDPHLHLLPSTPMNSILEGKIRDSFRNPSVAVSKFLQPVESQYDFIFFDCAPSLNLTNTACVAASQWVLLPTSPDKFSMMGLDQTLKELSQIEEDFGLHLKRKILLTRFDVRERVSSVYRDEILDKYKNWVFDSVIRTATDVKNVISRNQNLFDIKRSHAREDYDLVAREVLDWARESESRTPDLSKILADQKSL